MDSQCSGTLNSGDIPPRTLEGIQRRVPNRLQRLYVPDFSIRLKKPESATSSETPPRGLHNDTSTSRLLAASRDFVDDAGIGSRLLYPLMMSRLSETVCRGNIRNRFPR